MIYIDQAHLSHQLIKFNAGMHLYVEKLGLNIQNVVRWQAGALARTLINISPAAKPKSIESSVKGKFASLASDKPREFSSSKEGKQDVDWYAFASEAMYGVAKSSDMRGASVDDLYKLNYSIKVNKQGRIVGHHGKQKAFIWKKILTNARTVAALTDLLKSHIGRLKAAFAISWQDAGSIGTTPPQFVMRHVAGARSARAGQSIDETKSPGRPSFTIINRARGIENLKKKADSLLKRALLIRTNAMIADIKFALKNPEAWKLREQSAGRLSIFNG